MDKEYLKRELIPNIKYSITDNNICVCCDHTSYININRYKKIDINKLTNKRTKLIKLAKEKGVKISYKNKTKDRIKNYKDIYEKDYNRSAISYKQIKENWEHIRDIRGVHKGTSDDEFMNETSKLQNEYIALNYRNRAISIINELDYNLTKTLNNLSDNTMMIFL